jgi:uncharacterized protein (TIGR03437 family)
MDHSDRAPAVPCFTLNRSDAGSRRQHQTGEARRRAHSVWCRIRSGDARYSGGATGAATQHIDGEFTLSIGGVAAAVSYDGLAPGYTGLYQFNLTVPDVAADNLPLTFALGGEAGTQTLVLAVGS